MTESSCGCPQSLNSCWDSLSFMLHLGHSISIARTVAMCLRYSVWGALVWFLLQPPWVSAADVNISLYIHVLSAVHLRYIAHCQPLNAIPLCCDFLTCKPVLHWYSVAYYVFASILSLNFFSNLINSINVKCGALIYFQYTLLGTKLIFLYFGWHMLNVLNGLYNLCVYPFLVTRAILHLGMIPVSY
jgi:hypothetical protein